MDPGIYNHDYYDLVLRQNSSTAECICGIRWEFVSSVNPRTVLDYGAGVGWFRAFAPKWTKVDTYDIGPFVQTGIQHERYDLVTMWDVIEHIPDLDVLKDIFAKTSYVAMAVPILPEGKSLKEWKHYKPGEHLHYFTVRLLDEIMACYGFNKIKEGSPEGVLREDIVSVLYAKSNT